MKVSTKCKLITLLQAGVFGGALGLNLSPYAIAFIGFCFLVCFVLTLKAIRMDKNDK